MTADGQIHAQDFDNIDERLARIKATTDVLVAVYAEQDGCDTSFGLALEGVAQAILDASYRIAEVKEALEARGAILPSESVART